MKFYYMCQLPVHVHAAMSVICWWFACQLDSFKLNLDAIHRTLWPCLFNRIVIISLISWGCLCYMCRSFILTRFSRYAEIYLDKKESEGIFDLSLGVVFLEKRKKQLVLASNLNSGFWVQSWWRFYEFVMSFCTGARYTHWLVQWTPQINFPFTGLRNSTESRVDASVRAFHLSSFKLACCTIFNQKCSEDQQCSVIGQYEH